MMMDRILTQKKPDSVAAAIRDAILSGSIAGGEELTQNDLAESLGVSRMPVREALLALEYQGLVVRLPNNHVRVAVIDRSHLRDIFTACCRAEAPLLEALPDRPAELLSALSVPSPEAELYFHRCLCARLKNDFLRKQLETMTEIYAAFAVHAPLHDCRAACRLLSSAVTGRSAEALEGYFDYLIDSVPEA